MIIIKHATWLLIFFLSFSSVLAQQIPLEDRYLEVSTQDSCEEHNNMFRFENLNYTSGMDPIVLVYTYSFSIANYSFQDNYEKSFKKYTSSQTGWQPKNLSGIATITLETNNTTLFFNQSYTCYNNSEDLVNEITINESIINDTIINESIINASIINNTNDTSRFENSTIDNHSQYNDSNSTINTSIVPNCIVGNITTNKDIFRVGEKIKMNFIFENNPDEYTYSITDLFGVEVKKPITSSTKSTKSHTWRSFNAREATYGVHLQAKDICSNRTEYVTVINEAYEEEVCTQEEQTDQTSCIQDTPATLVSLDVESTTYKDNTFLVYTLQIARGDTRKSVIEVDLFHGTQKIMPTQKITVQELSDVHIQGNYLVSGIDGDVHLKVKGLGYEIEKTIQLTSVDTQEESEPSQEQRTTTLSAQVTKEQYKPTFSELNPVAVKESSTKHILSASLVILVLGILIGFGPKKSVDRFIKP